MTGTVIFFAILFVKDVAVGTSDTTDDKVSRPEARYTTVGETHRHLRARIGFSVTELFDTDRKRDYVTYRNSDIWRVTYDRTVAEQPRRATVVRWAWIRCPMHESCSVIETSG